MFLDQNEKDKSTKHYKDKSIIVQIIISVISTLLVLLTLFEMQAERNAAYRLSLSIGNTEIAFTWDSEYENRLAKKEQSLGGITGLLYHKEKQKRES